MELERCLARFDKRFRRLFRQHQATPNLSPLQRATLEDLRADDDIVITNSDKDLGPVEVKFPWYVEDGLVHLKDARTYRILTEEEALADVAKLHQDILDWTFRWQGKIPNSKLDYLQKHLELTRAEPFGFFYLLYKLHKTPLKTRLVCSDCASLPHALGQWVDGQLQPVVQQRHTYFRDTFHLKKKLGALEVPPDASLFTYDAVSMYTNIDTNNCIEHLSNFLHSAACKADFPHLVLEAIIETLILVMKNTKIKFRDLFVLQLIGIVMGMSRAPTISNLYVAFHARLRRSYPGSNEISSGSATSSMMASASGSLIRTLPSTLNFGQRFRQQSTMGASPGNSPKGQARSILWTSQSPWWVPSSKPTYSRKRWPSIFTCHPIQAIHLESWQALSSAMS
ncbi:hypothetical protein ACHAWF_001605 [Thalassiosira exigua]